MQSNKTISHTTINGYQMWNIKFYIRCSSTGVQLSNCYIYNLMRNVLHSHWNRIVLDFDLHAIEMQIFFHFINVFDIITNVLNI